MEGKGYKNGDFRLHILNEKNRYITEKFINSIFKKYGVEHKVKNINNYQLAMTHISYVEHDVISEKTEKILLETEPLSDEIDIEDVIPLQKQNYGVLEFLGDSVLHHILTEYLIKRYENGNIREGFLTKLRAELEKRDNLSIWAMKLGLHKYALIARNIEYADGRKTNTALTEDLFESFVGAFSQEADFETCTKFVINFIEKEEDLSEILSINTDYKSRLMIYFHEMKWKDPKYIEDINQTIERREAGRDICTYVVYVQMEDGKKIGKGQGDTKSKAQKMAAYGALKKLGLIKEEEESESDYYGEETSESETSVYYSNSSSEEEIIVKNKKNKK